MAFDTRISRIRTREEAVDNSNKLIEDSIKMNDLEKFIFIDSLTLESLDVETLVTDAYTSEEAATILDTLRNATEEERNSIARDAIDRTENKNIINVRERGVLRGALVKLQQDGDSDLVPKDLLSNILTFQYNPSVIRNKKAIDYTTQRGPATYQSDVQYVGGNSRVFSFVLELNAYGESNTYVDFTTFSGKRKFKDLSYVYDTAPRLKLNRSLIFLESLIKPREPSLFWSRPPTVLFLYGVNTPIKCLVRDLSFDYTMFDPNLQIIRATCSIDLEYVGEEISQSSQYIYFPGAAE